MHRYFLDKSINSNNVLTEQYQRGSSAIVKVHSSSFFPSFCRRLAFLIFFSTGELGSFSILTLSSSQISTTSLFSSSSWSPLYSDSISWSSGSLSSPDPSGPLSHSSSSGSGIYRWTVRSASILAG